MCLYSTFLGFHNDVDLGIPSNISSVKLVERNSASVTSRDAMFEMESLLQQVRPFLNDMNSFKIILLLLLTESEYSPSFKRLHTALASAILRNAASSGNSQCENDILTPYYSILQNTKRIHQIISEFIRDFCPKWNNWNWFYGNIITNMYNINIICLSQNKCFCINQW